MKRLLGWSCLLALALASQAAAQTSPISKDRIREDVRVLSSDAFLGRGPGQAGEPPTLEHLVAAFKAAGLQPGGPGGSWLQDVPLTVFDRHGPAGFSLKLPGAPAQPLAVGRDVTASSRLIGPNRLAGAAIVFVGYGVKAPALGWDSFAGVDLHGKVALVLANDPDFEAAPDSPAFGKFGGKAMVYPGRFGAKVAAAQAAGAEAVLVIHEDAAASYPWRQVANGDRIVTMAPGTPETAASKSGLTGWLQRDVAVRLLKGAGLDLDQLKVAARDPGFKPRVLPGVTLSAHFSVTARAVVSHNVAPACPAARAPTRW